MSGVNHVQVEGRVGSLPVEVEGKKRRFCYFQVAHRSDKRFPATWVNVVCFGKSAEVVMDQLDLFPGDWVIVMGHLKNRRIEVGTEHKFNTLEVMGHTVFPLIRSKKHPRRHEHMEPAYLDEPKEEAIVVEEDIL